MTEAELVDACQKQNPTAQHMLYEQYGGKLYALCIRYMGERAKAEDLLHDGFIKLFTAIKQFTYRGEGSLEAWLSRVMVNMALEQLRKEKLNAPLRLTEQEEEQLASDTTHEEEEEQLTHLTQEELMSFIARLPHGYRTVFNLYTFEEKSHKEIATLLHINEKSSSSQLHRAKTLLHKMITEHLHTHHL